MLAFLLSCSKEIETKKPLDSILNREYVAIKEIKDSLSIKNAFNESGLFLAALNWEDDAFKELLAHATEEDIFNALLSLKSTPKLYKKPKEKLKVLKRVFSERKELAKKFFEDSKLNIELSMLLKVFLKKEIDTEEKIKYIRFIISSYRETDKYKKIKNLFRLYFEGDNIDFKDRFTAKIEHKNLIKYYKYALDHDTTKYDNKKVFIFKILKNLEKFLKSLNTSNILDVTIDEEENFVQKVSGWDDIFVKKVGKEL